MPPRLISQSEAGVLLHCQYAHALRYTGALTEGTVLSPKCPALNLRMGKAWGVAMAAWHARQDTPEALAYAKRGATNRDEAAIIALHDALAEDAAELQEHGLYVAAEHDEVADELEGYLRHYMATAEPLACSIPEHEIIVPIPGMKGDFRLQVYIDNLHHDEDGNAWIVDYKLRTSGRFVDTWKLQLDRQLRWYSWAAREAFDIEPVGFILDERLAELPQPVRLNKPRKRSEKDGGGFYPAVPSKIQSCAPEEYIAACEAAGVEPDEEVLNGLRRKRYQRRTETIFRDGELDEVPAELRTIARMVAALEQGKLDPIRNPSPLCRGCEFRDICPDVAGSRDLIDTIFVREAPKCKRSLEEQRRK